VTKGEPEKQGTSRDADSHAAYSGVLAERVSAHLRSTPEDLHDERQDTCQCLSYARGRWGPAHMMKCIVDHESAA